MHDRLQVQGYIYQGEETQEIQQQAACCQNDEALETIQGGAGDAEACLLGMHWEWHIRMAQIGLYTKLFVVLMSDWVLMSY